MAGQNNHHLIWIDLEMTGLTPEKDHILEIASLITDNQLTIIAKGPSLVIHYDQQELVDMSQWVTEHHTRSGLLTAVHNSTINCQQAEDQTLSFLKLHCQAGQSPLCGNSVWQDRAFLRLHMPRLNDFLHYRIIDVTSVKELVKRWYEHDPRSNYKKRDSHRALDDIQESIEELSYYKENFFINQ